MTMSGVDDELIKQGENVLLTFRTSATRPARATTSSTQATRTTLDMSVALGQDMTGSAMQLGKALNDPIKGVTALRRVGVQFTDAQTGSDQGARRERARSCEAQKIILRELQREFGGSAKAAGETLPGKLNILRNTLLNLAGSIAAMLTPAITKLVDKMVAWLSKSKNQKAVLDTVKAAASAVETVVRLLAGAFQVLNKITGSTKNTFLLLLGAFVTFKALKLGAYIAADGGGDACFRHRLGRCECGGRRRSARRPGGQGRTAGAAGTNCRPGRRPGCRCPSQVPIGRSSGATAGSEQDAAGADRDASDSTSRSRSTGRRSPTRRLATTRTCRLSAEGSERTSAGAAR